VNPKGTVYDLGYARYEGERLGRRVAMRAIVVDGMRRALGLRRKARAKVLPWFLIGSAIVPAVVMVTLTFVVAGFELDQDSPFGSHADYFDTIGTLTMLFIALVAPTLLIPDRRHRILAMYASRPVSAADYLLSRGGALVLLSSLFILIPHATLYLGIAGLDAGGLWAGLVRNAPKIPAILGTTVAYVIGYGVPALLVSVYVKRVATATGVYVVAMFLMAGLAEAIPQATDALIYKVVAPLLLFYTPMNVRDALFDASPDPALPLDKVGLPSWSALAVLVTLTVVTGFLAHRRYRRDL